MLSPIVVMGGTFDPVHYGHLRTALEIAQLLGDHAIVHMMPCGDPRHRDAPEASAQHRIAMLERAVANEPKLLVSCREVDRKGATYTVDTLSELRQEVGAQRPIVFVMGADAFLSLPKWHQWVEIIHLAHIMVSRRPNWTRNGQGDLNDLLRKHSAKHLNELSELPCGRIAECAFTQLDISSTHIRDLLRTEKSPRFLTPDTVLGYIRSHRLYGCNCV